MYTILCGALFFLYTMTCVLHWVCSRFHDTWAKETKVRWLACSFFYTADNDSLSCVCSIKAFYIKSVWKWMRSIVPSLRRSIQQHTYGTMGKLETNRFFCRNWCFLKIIVLTTSTWSCHGIHTRSRCLSSLTRSGSSFCALIVRFFPNYFLFLCDKSQA